MQTNLAVCHFSGSFLNNSSSVGQLSDSSRDYYNTSNFTAVFEFLFFCANFLTSNDFFGSAKIEFLPVYAHKIVKNFNVKGNTNKHEGLTNYYSYQAY